MVGARTIGDDASQNRPSIFNMLESIKGKVYTVTGAASGIGQATAIQLAELGAAGVAISDVNEVALQETAARIRKLYSARLIGSGILTSQ